MPLHENNRLLVEALEKLPLLDGRFRDISLVNYDSVADDKRGCLSVVFRAYDVVGETWVALKFYDLNPALTNDMYRLACFHRECELLLRLLNAARCLQLVKGIGTYNLIIEVAPGVNVTLGCRYFVVEWIAKDIDDYFLKQDSFDPIDRLKLFNDIVLAVEALHTRDVCHRDLKMDNLRQSDDAKDTVVAIDLGTAARSDSPPLGAVYGTPVGARAYASPEAICGLAGIREIGAANDTYALGCLLYELFNRDHFYNAIRNCNANLDARLAAMSLSIPKPAPPDRQLSEWKDALHVLGAGICCPKIDGAGASLPAALGPLLNPLLAGLTNVDFAKRPPLQSVRQRLWSAINLLRHERAYQSRLVQMRMRRAQRIEKLHAKEVRLLGRPKRGETPKC